METKIKITKEEFIRLAKVTFGNKWQAKLGSPENHRRFGAWWCYLGEFNEDGSRSMLPLTKYTDWARDVQSEKELVAKIQEFNSRPAFGAGLNFQEFASLYLSEAIRISRIDGIDSPADWTPGLLRPTERPWFERCRRAAQNAAIALSGGVGNCFQRRANIEAVFNSVGVSISQRDALGAAPTQEEWEEAFVRLFTKNLEQF